MNRKEFLRNSVASCCGAALCLVPGSSAMAAGESKAIHPETPCDKKVHFTKGWIQRLMTVLDNNLDEQTRHGIMKENGRACYLSHNKGPREEKMSVAGFVKEMASYVGKENCFLEDGEIFYNYAKNPNGLKVSDGFCLCPMVENGPERLSPTYCHCSIGYIHEMVAHFVAPPEKVELLESIRTGGKSCRFRIRV